MTQGQYIIVGTAGHIDHGKTTLVKALTGLDTDTHKEEKERGISIDIGFAPLSLPDGRRIGVIDVPGHEKFIKNMLAGAAGIDLILLVIDANEGIMPQTTEHLHIVEMLHVQKGIVVLTKIDTVDEEWLALVTEEVREGLRGSTLADAPIIPVSAVTGQGIEGLRELIAEMAREIKPREVNAPFRMPVDRVFSVPGFGTVVTGTVLAGSAKVGDAVEIQPSGEQVRIRSIQVHGETTEKAQAGQRTALNLAGIERSELARGYVIATPKVFKPTSLIDARFRLLSDSPWTLANRMRVRLYVGTSEVMGRVVLLDRDEMQPGEDALIQIDLEAPVVCEAKDHFILRTYSPMHTIGGGIVIDPHPNRLYRRNRPHILEELESREKGGPHARILQIAEEETGLNLTELAARMKATQDQTKAWVEELADRGQLRELPGNNGYVTFHALDKLLDEIEEKIRSHYARERFHNYVAKAQVLSQLSRKLKPKVYDAILELGAEAGRLEVKQDRIRLVGYTVPLSSKEQQMMQDILKKFREQAYQPPTLQELLAAYKGQDKIVQGIVSLLKETDALVEVEEGILFAKETIEQTPQILRKISGDDGFSVAEFRDHVGTSRKFALALLEYMDRVKITKRMEDKRVLLKEP
ncbi:selenocysteine-specific translation elongation factor [Effusibacillus lacus]|uniref:Selenocysteine-specific elongation factor n=1 Tax=Effusibacillus lacus TaxID=1348429 RepID=A0A292YQL5_9BACL|nr:selenocysteine-specific translation elongation factor [Effusibacillus lacus]GAX90795.1 selenocysteine-specific translation elongation factor [Effusibacillus lacus]